MNRRGVLALAFLALPALAGCASTGATMRTAPERAITISASSKQVKDEVALLFVGRGWQLKSDSDYLMQFESLTNNFMASLLLSSNYDSRVMTRVVVTLIGDKPTQLSWRGYLVTNPGSAFERLTEITNNPDGDKVQAEFQNIKLKLEGGAK